MADDLAHRRTELLVMCHEVKERRECATKKVRVHTHTLTLEQGDNVRLSKYRATEFLHLSSFFLFGPVS